MNSIEINKKRKVRDSNIEFLRIVSMVAVLLFHANFESIGFPTYEMAANKELFCLSSFFVESLTSICVDVFILISGWYGIRFKMQRLFALLFQIFFFKILITSVILLFGVKLSITEIVEKLFILDNAAWFVKAYIYMYIVSIILNYFTDKAAKREFELLLILVYIFLLVFGYFSNGAKWIENGLSAPFLIFLYLLGRYLNIHGSIIIKKIGQWGGGRLYLITSLIVALLSFLIMRLFLPVGLSGKLYSYISPIVIFQSLCLFVCFHDISMRSSIINWIGSSVFGVYLLHADSYIFKPIYCGFISKWYEINPSFLFLIKVIIWIFVFFVMGILIDKIRSLCWNVIFKYFEK